MQMNTMNGPAVINRIQPNVRTVLRVISESEHCDAGDSSTVWNEVTVRCSRDLTSWHQPGRAGYVHTTQSY